MPAMTAMTAAAVAATASRSVRWSFVSSYVPTDGWLLSKGVCVCPLTKHWTTIYFFNIPPLQLVNEGFNAARGAESATITLSVNIKLLQKDRNHQWSKSAFNRV